MPLVSVVTPASRGVKYLSQLLRDFRNQTFTDFEHCIVWDGPVPADVQKFMNEHAKDYNLKFCSVPKDMGNMHVSPGTNPRNYGVQIATGKFIVFADDDDRYKDAYLETLISHASDTSITVVQISCQKSRIYKNGSPDEIILIPEVGVPIFPMECHVGAPSSIVRREWALAEPWRHEIDHDYWFYKRIMDHFRPTVYFVGGMLVDIDGLVIRGMKDWLSKPFLRRSNIPVSLPPIPKITAPIAPPMPQPVVKDNLPPKMEFTGERYVPDTLLPIIACEHWHRYLYATEMVKNKKVLDIASGEGFGTHVLSEHANSVVGVDISEEAVRHASKKYKKQNLKFKKGSVTEIPVEDSVFDVAVSFETIEHITEQEQEKFMQELKRVLKPEGVFIVSTPNKLLYTDIPQHKNEFHIKEFYLEEFSIFIRKYFKYCVFLGQKTEVASYIWNVESQSNICTEYKLGFESGIAQISKEPKQIIYSMAVASDEEIEGINNSLLIDINDAIFGIKNRIINALSLENQRLKGQIYSH